MKSYQLKLRSAVVIVGLAGVSLGGFVSIARLIRARATEASVRYFLDEEKDLLREANLLERSDPGPDGTLKGLTADENRALRAGRVQGIRDVAEIMRRHAEALSK
jgi:hypothetical protein